MSGTVVVPEAAIQAAAALPPPAPLPTSEKGGAPTTVLDQLVAEGALRSQSHEWLLAALDPYHDFQISPAGLPDICGTNTVTMCVKQSMTISKPSHLGDVQWDAHIFNLPQLTSSHNAIFKYGESNGQLSYDAPGEYQSGRFSLGLVNAVTMGNGVDCFPGPNVSPNNWTTTHAVQHLAPELPEGTIRVIGCGFEVTNVTAPVYASGSVRAYRTTGSAHMTTAWADTYKNIDVLAQPGGVLTTMTYEDPRADGIASIPGSITDINSFGAPHEWMVEKVLAPPNNLTAATLVPDSVQWHAKFGGYSVVTLTDMQPELEPHVNHGRIYTSDYAGATGSGDFAITTVASAADPARFRVSAPSALFPGLNISGQYYTGLDPRTQLTVTTRTYIEVAPSPDSPLMPIAKPSAPYDPLAFELYAKAIRQLPPCTPVSNNASGDFFKGVLGTLGSGIRAALHTVNPILGAGVDVIGDGLKNLAIRKFGPRRRQRRLFVEGQPPRRTRQPKGQGRVVGQATSRPRAPRER